ncbi:DUF4124 domain-containing protein [Pseudoxanthomonas winnipegensis]|uniref:DUF4124 domain-containing protein n=1 Tax=Pseudoxanthomonas winnipegensis TaxID=2480810 RepID=UPI003CCE96F6
MDRIALVCAALLALAAPAHAQSVWKCRDAAGGVVYQSSPCANAEKRWDVAPGARYGSRSPDDQMSASASEYSIDRARAQVRANNAPRYSGAVVGGGGGSAVTRSSRPVSGENRGYVCQAARNAADSARRQIGHRLTFAGASAMDRSVRDACK